MKTSQMVIAGGIAILVLAILLGIGGYLGTFRLGREEVTLEAADVAVAIADARKWETIGFGVMALGLAVVIGGFVLGVREK